MRSIKATVAALLLWADRHAPSGQLLDTGTKSHAVYHWASK